MGYRAVKFNMRLEKGLNRKHQKSGTSGNINPTGKTREASSLLCFVPTQRL